MPWQQHVADVVLEIDPLTGRLAYTEFGLTVPRQSGKSVWVLAKAVHRASATKFFGPRQHIVYTAQTRLKAREKWEEDYVEALQSSRDFKAKIAVHKGNGQEHIRFVNRSRFGIEANTEKAGHGGTLDEAYIDEAFAQADGRLEQAFGPAMITRRNKQLGWISTAGWLNGSPYLRQKVDTGRAQAEMGVREGLAYFEWSAPEDADPSDRDVWRGCMPALGHTISEDAVAHELAKAIREGKLNDFRRAYLNLWVPKDVAGEWRVIPQPDWQALADPESSVVDPVAFAAHFFPDHGKTAIAVAGRRADDLLHVEVADYRQGIDWVAPRLLELRDRWKPCAIVMDSKRHGFYESAVDLGLDIDMPTAQDVAGSCGRFLEACKPTVRGLRHMGQPELAAALAAAQKRPLGDGWAWAYKDVPTDQAPLVAVTLAAWGLAVYCRDESQPFFGSWR